MTYSAQLGSSFANSRSSARRPGPPRRGCRRRRYGPLAVEGLEDRTLFALEVTPFQTTGSALALAQELLLGANTGITITGATYVGADGQAGTYTGFDFLSRETRLAISDGVLLTSGLATNALGPNGNNPDRQGIDAGEASNHLNLPGDADLTTLLGDQTGDANALIITFTAAPTVQSILFDFVFGSEEFPDFVGAVNDGFGAYLDGTQVSADTDGQPITVNNNFFLLNNSGLDANPIGGDPDTAGTTGVFFDVEYDGLTPVIRTQAPLNTALATHTLKFVIADARPTPSGFEVDSGVFLAGLQGSVQTLDAPTTDLPQSGVFNFEPVSITKTENELFATITVTRTLGASGLVNVDIFSSDGSAVAGLDYTAFPNTTLTFADQQTVQQITIPLLDDSFAEGTEFFFVNLANATNAAGIGLDNQATVTLLDNEFGVQLLQSVFTVQEGIETVQANVTVVLTGPIPSTLTVDFATTAGGTAIAGADFQPVSGTLTFQPGGPLSQTVSINIFDDFLVEDTETITFTLSNVSAPFTLGLTNPGSIQILNLDRPPAVVDGQFVTNERFINGIAIRFSEPMSEPQAEDLLNYDIFLRKESKRLGGSPTRTRMDIVSAVYDPTSRTVTLTTAKQLKEGKVFELIANTTRLEGLESVEGERVDGNYDNVPGEAGEGDDFTGYFSRGKKITYFDTTGDQARVQLKGPGKLEIFRNVERDVRVLRMLETSQDTILTGSLLPVPITDNKTTIDKLIVGTGFRNRLPQPAFTIIEIINGFAEPDT